MLFKFQKIVGCIEPWVENRDTNRIVSLCIVTALLLIFCSEPKTHIKPTHISTIKNKVINSNK